MASTQIVINIPDFKGYRTLVVNGAVALLGIAAIIWPGKVLPTPEAIGLGYDQLAGAVATIIGIINAGLRFLTTSPPAINPLGVEPSITAADVNNAYANGRRDVVIEARAKREAEMHNARLTAQMAKHSQDAYSGGQGDPFDADRLASPVASSPAGGLPGGSLGAFALTFAASALCSLPVWIIGLKAFA